MTLILTLDWAGRAVNSDGDRDQHRANPDGQAGQQKQQQQPPLRDSEMRVGLGREGRYEGIIGALLGGTLEEIGDEADRADRNEE
jgi:hypothetical protein